ncbi:hypothetical protein GCM10020370_57920 [Paenibacillus hodogayensis]
MKSKAVSRTLLFLFVLLFVPIAYGPGRPVQADEAWIAVSGPAELNNMRNQLTGKYRLIQDIDLAGYDDGDGGGWKPIGTTSGAFAGQFDGNGFAIRNMRIARPNDNGVGLFGTTNGATITNVHLTNVQVEGSQDVGGIAGGLQYSSLSLSSVEGSVTGRARAGVMVGYHDFSTIADSYAAGRLVVAASPADSFGGLVGYGASNNSQASIVRSYSTASVGNGSFSGGLIGQRDGPAPVASSYWDTQASGQLVSAGGMGKTTAEMMDRETFVDWDIAGNGSADPVWGMVQQATYPLHFGDYKKVALGSLTVKDTDDTLLKLDREFSSAYGSYAVQVVSKTDHIVVSGTPLRPSSSVSVDGGGAANTLALQPGRNEIPIEVRDSADPTGRKAVYKLIVYRDAGTVQLPHRITTAEQLSKLGDPSAGYGLDQVYALQADLDLSGYATGAGWSPIGTEAEPFRGTFRGNGHTISHLTIQRPGDDHVGLFGFAFGASVSDLALPDADVRGNRHVGALVGHANQTAVSGVAVQGAVAGIGDIAGLIGSADALTTVSESYGAATVTAEAGGAGGLIASGAAAGAVTDSFWDREASGQAASSGGGTPKPTVDLMRKATYTNYPGSVWQFGNGHRWGMIEGTTYPMPLDAYRGVSLQALAVIAPGTTVSVAPSTFQPDTGTYTAALAAPVSRANVTVVPGAGQIVTINGMPGPTADIGLGLGNQTVRIDVKGANGAKGVYRLTIQVPSPVVEAVRVPAKGKYGIGAALDFIAAYDFPVDVDHAGAPVWPIRLDSGAERAAVYAGKLEGDASKLLFRYTVQEGDRGSAGIVPATALAALAPLAITANGDPVSLQLPAPLPNTAAIVIDGVKPDIGLTPSTTAPTTGSVVVAVYADGTGTGVAGLKWAKGVRPVTYFSDAGTAITASSFVADENGSYTVYAADEAGNRQVRTIEIANIVTERPTVRLDYSPKLPVRTGVDVTVAASVYGSGAGNRLAVLKWAAGERTETDFDSPSVGADVPPGGSFRVTSNGTYTVYAADAAGNRQVQTIEIANIVTERPTIALSAYPTSPVRTGVDVAVTASVYGSGTGNRLEVLKWAAGERSAVEMASPSVGSDVPAGSAFRVSANGMYTVYAADTAGNGEVRTIEIRNIVTEPPRLALDYTPKEAGGIGVDVTVLVQAGSEAAGNRVETVKWVAGSFTVAEFRSGNFGADVPPSRTFRVTANGSYTVYAADTVGNDRVEMIRITTIADSGNPDHPGEPAASSGTEASTDGDGNRFYLVPGKESTIAIPGLTLFIPAGAIERATTVTVARVTEEARGLLEPGQALLSGVFDLRKDTPGTFQVPVRLSLDLTAREWSDGQRPVLAYYDETAKTWMSIGGTVSGGTVTGETDHFTTFAVLAVRREQEEAPEAKPNPEPVLTDIDRHWAAKAIRNGVAGGLIDGYPDGTFRPDASVSRAEFTVMLGRTLHWREEGPVRFEDRADIPAWAHGAVAAAVQAGVIGGYPDHTFRPAAGISRAEMAVMIAKAAGLPRPEALMTSFADGDAVGEWALPFVEAAREAGLVQGKADDRFEPDVLLTRAEAVVLLLRLSAYGAAQHG